MEDWQQRVVDEQKELQVRLEKLRLFLVTKMFDSLSLVQQQLLREQEYVMSRYNEILVQRISFF